MELVRKKMEMEGKPIRWLTKEPTEDKKGNGDKKDWKNRKKRRIKKGTRKR